MERPVGRQDFPAIEVIERALVRADESYRFRAGSLDTKAGLVLGAVGVIVALVGDEPSVAGFVGQLFAIASGLMAVLSLRPRTGDGINPSKLRDQYLQLDDSTARLRVLNDSLSELSQDNCRLKAKNRQFQAAATLLLLAAATVVAGAAISVFAG